MTGIELRLLLLIAVVLAAIAIAKILRAYVANATYPNAFDLKDVGVTGSSAVIVQFTSPYCYECREVFPLLKAASMVHNASLTVVDAKDRPDLAGKYRIRSTPTVLVVEPSGKVKRGWVGSPTERDLEAALQAIG